MPVPPPRPAPGLSTADTRATGAGPDSLPRDDLPSDGLASGAPARAEPVPGSGDDARGPERSGGGTARPGTRALPPVHPVLLCGGSGTRLWPLSRKGGPKQFARLTGSESLFQAAARRLSGPGFAAPLVVTGEEFRFIVTEQLAGLEIAPRAILIEPAPRNTAPAILAAALALEQLDPGALVLAAPSDHVIPDAAGFRAAVAAAVPAALAGRIVTFGIRPDRPETGYGWLEIGPDPGAGGGAGLGPGAAPAAGVASGPRSGSRSGSQSGPAPQDLLRFVEKPDAATAAALLAGGRHLWNAGIFLASVPVLLAAFTRHAPGLLSGTRAAVSGAVQDLGFTRLDPAPWEGLEAISVDYAVMEKAGNLSVLPYAGRWSDLGDWDAVWRGSGPDDAGMVTEGPVTAIGCEGSLLRAEAGGPELVGIGLRDLVAVAMPDAVLIADRSRAQEVRQAVAALKARGAPAAEGFLRVLRPWGWVETLAAGPGFEVRRISVHPGAALSLQSHRHRAEHWVLVVGTARVTIGTAVQRLEVNQSVYIPQGARHRLENPGAEQLVLIEVQTGAVLSEDDIIRYEDIYGRACGPEPGPDTGP